jgi:hypothetical protein
MHMPKRTSAQLTRHAPQEIGALVDTRTVLPAVRVPPPLTSVGLLPIRRTTTPPVPLIARLQDYLAIRDVGDIPNLPAVIRFHVASPDESKADVALPFGVPRHVRAGMLKLLAGGRQRDSMLELKGEAWEFVADESIVDLKDRSRVFRVGRALIHS